MMRVFIAGKYGPYPAAGGATSGYLLEAGMKTFSIDMGSGVLARVRAELAPERLDALFISHLHFDHMSDLGVLRYDLEQAQREGRREAALPVYVPDAQDASLAPYASSVFSFITMPEALEIEEMRFTRFDNVHPAPCWGLRVEADDRVFVYTADTRIYDALSQHCGAASFLLCDACLPEAQWNANAPHMSIRQAGELAREAGVEKLCLTHLRPDIAEEAVAAEAQSAFTDAFVAEEGRWYTV